MLRDGDAVTLIANGTTFIVAHRLATLAHCDVVYAVEDGRLVPTRADDSSAPLMDNRGLALESVMAMAMDAEPGAGHALASPAASSAAA